MDVRTHVPTNVNQRRAGSRLMRSQPDKSLQLSAGPVLCKGQLQPATNCGCRLARGERSTPCQVFLRSDMSACWPYCGARHGRVGARGHEWDCCSGPGELCRPGGGGIEHMSGSFLDLLSVNRGHFALESGLHGNVWFDLEKAFVQPSRITPFTEALSEILSEYNLDMVCGALVGGAFVAYSIAERLDIGFVYSERYVTGPDGQQKVGYRLPRASEDLVTGRRIGVIDDAINAGSAVTKTCDNLRELGANPVVIAGILTVGRGQPKRLPGKYPSVVSLEHLESSLWNPGECPLCRDGAPLVDPYGKGI